MEQILQNLQGESVVLGAILGVLASFAVVIGIVGAIVFVLTIIANWKVFKKAGEKGWKSLIPVYNLYVQMKFSWKTAMFWLLLALSVVMGILGQFDNVICSLLNLAAAIATLVISIKQCVYLSKAFGHGGGFAAGLFFLPFIFTMILGFGKSQYVGNPIAAEPAQIEEPVEAADEE